MSIDPIETLLLKTRVKLLLDQPLIGQVILHLEMEDASDWCTTAATDGRKLYYNREFIKSLTLDELVFLAGHETLHVIYDHVYRRGSRDKGYWNMACLAWDTNITMADGTTQPIQRVLPGDYIASPNGPSKVLGNAFSGIKETFQYQVGNCQIRSTSDHKYASKNGFFDAETLSNTSSDGYVLNDTGRSQDRNKLFKHCPISQQSRIKCESLFAEAIELDSIYPNVGIGVVVPCRDCGRGGNDLNSPSKRQILAATDFNFQYISLATGMARSAGLQMYCSEKSVGKELLFHEHVVMGNRQRVESLVALSRDQKTARTNFTQHYTNPKNASTAWRNDAGHPGFDQGNPGIESARFSVREGSRKCAPVFDLITENGVLFANQVVTHNCDYIVNYVLVTSKIGKMPNSALYHDAYTDDFSADELCTLLEQTMPTVQMPMDLHLDGTAQATKKNADGGGDGVTISGGPDLMSDSEMTEIRETMRSIIMTAAQNTPPGKMPAGIKRLLDKLLAPKLNWRQILFTLLRSTVKYDYTYTRLSRRSWSSGLILPGQDVKERVTATAWLDGSGSTSQKMVTDFLGECRGIMNTFRDYELTVGTFDTEVYNVKTFTPDNSQEINDYVFKGGGGTWPSCCWNYMKEKQLKPDKILLFTDGEVGSDWGDPSYADTIFIVHSNAEATAPYGRTIHYEP